ncbi:MAG: DNA-binding transcriptional activator PspC [Parcubacteria group bacterium]|nr:DNA-binding transcriptional activator PspC [Parcubacteria group bacterium]
MTKLTRRLTRSTVHRVIAGVCGGIADHLDVDPVLVRLVSILLTFATGLGPGIIMYLIAWAIIPEGPYLPDKVITPEPVESEHVHKD